MLDLSDAEESVELAEAERLAEDLRLLYVALTRSVWHCSLGVAPLVRRRGDKRGYRCASERPWSPVAKGEPMDAAGLRGAIEALCCDDIACQIPAQPDGEPRRVAQSVSSELSAKYCSVRPAIAGA